MSRNKSDMEKLFDILHLIKKHVDKKANLNPDNKHEAVYSVFTGETHETGGNEVRVYERRILSMKEALRIWDDIYA